jgi:hypothetical protein
MKRAIFLLSICLFAAAAFADITGSISGTVKDAAGSVLAGAVVTAHDVDTGVATPTKTNRDGSYSFPDLPVGHYSLQVEAKGFANKQETGIILEVNTALRLDGSMQLNSVRENVEVQANAVRWTRSAPSWERSSAAPR